MEKKSWQFISASNYYLICCKNISWVTRELYRLRVIHSVSDWKHGLHVFAWTNGTTTRKLGRLHVSNLVGDRFASMGLLAIAGPLLFVGMVRRSKTTTSDRGCSFPDHPFCGVLLLQFRLFVHALVQRNLMLVWITSSPRSLLSRVDS